MFRCVKYTGSPEPWLSHLQGGYKQPIPSSKNIVLCIIFLSVCISTLWAPFSQSLNYWLKIKISLTSSSFVPQTPEYLLHARHCAQGQENKRNQARSCPVWSDSCAKPRIAEGKCGQAEWDMRKQGGRELVLGTWEAIKCPKERSDTVRFAPRHIALLLGRGEGG